MPLTEEERKAIVVYRLEKADDAFIEAKDCASMGHWTLAASRLYYAAYYASSALLVSAGYTAKTHEGTIGMIGQNYIRAGILEKEDGALLFYTKFGTPTANLFILRIIRNFFRVSPSAQKSG